MIEAFLSILYKHFFFFFAIKIFQKFRMTNKIISLQFNVIFHTIKKI